MTLSQSASPDEPHSRSVSRGAGRALLWPAAAVALGSLLIHHSLTSPPDSKPPTRSAAVAPSQAPVLAAPPALDPTGAASGATRTPPALVVPRPTPTRMVIPQIGVDAPFTALSLAASGHLNAPPVNNKNLVGWFKDGAAPGERGTSIVVGHVDTKTGPAVFVLLRTLKPGNTVDITRADGKVARFSVDSVETYNKATFPDDRVYANAPTPQLRLITCGGAYNRSAHEYEANVVVFAHLMSLKRS
ncbi:class F sortase [Streptomyces nodosus]|uniref:class F sortase n=1 Tax=Streptomyces nodosus TaxID=40318 RepID=UPI0036F09372